MAQVNGGNLKLIWGNNVTILLPWWAILDLNQ
jgi:hypothetical protein